ncbi:MAG: universal stress protein [Sandaracinaceae bacterium]|nr:universal stress protein [Sandaracinaceae bacterium]
MSIIAHAYAGTSEADRPAQRAAVALAASSGSKLLSVHADDGSPGQSPPERASVVLAEWGRDPASVEHEVRIQGGGTDPVEVVLGLLERAEPDLVVMGTSQRRGSLRAMLESRAEAIAAHLAVPALIVPTEGRPLVDEKGAIQLRRVLVPAGDEAATRAALERVGWLVDLARAEDVQGELLHVAVGGELVPELTPPDHPRTTWSRRVRSGPLTAGIADEARRADVIVMATRGHDSVMDWIFGTHTERVLRKLDCPLLIVPMG